MVNRASDIRWALGIGMIACWLFDISSNYLVTCVRGPRFLIKVFFFKKIFEYFFLRFLLSLSFIVVIIIIHYCYHYQVLSSLKQYWIFFFFFSWNCCFVVYLIELRLRNEKAFFLSTSWYVDSMLQGIDCD